MNRVAKIKYAFNEILEISEYLIIFYPLKSFANVKLQNYNHL